MQIFCAPSFDDKILEVVAVFGGMQMAVSRVIKLQHHRIAQVRPHIKKTMGGTAGGSLINFCIELNHKRKLLEEHH